jgi:hypothetical protein
MDEHKALWSVEIDRSSLRQAQRKAPHVHPQSVIHRHAQKFEISLALAWPTARYTYGLIRYLLWRFWAHKKLWCLMECIAVLFPFRIHINHVFFCLLQFWHVDICFNTLQSRPALGEHFLVPGFISKSTTQRDYFCGNISTVYFIFSIKFENVARKIFVEYGTQTWAMELQPNNHKIHGEHFRWCFLLRTLLCSLVRVY